jgi:hypothetical protein
MSAIGKIESLPMNDTNFSSAASTVFRQGTLSSKPIEWNFGGTLVYRGDYRGAKRLRLRSLAWHYSLSIECQGAGWLRASPLYFGINTAED